MVLSAGMLQLQAEGPTKQQQHCLHTAAYVCCDLLMKRSGES